MKKELLELFDESIQLETNVAELYKIFGATFPDDAFFWKRLAMEEENHVTLLQNGKDRFGPLGKVPIQMLLPSIQELKSVNSEIKDIMKRCNGMTPSREEAFNIAIELEPSAGELHFQ